VQELEELIEDCKAIVVEGEFTSRFTLVECYHQLGTRIIKELNETNEKDILQRVATGIGKSLRTIYQAVQFARRFASVDSLPEGKAISWHKIANEILPKSKADKTDEPHVHIFKCKCGQLYETN